METKFSMSQQCVLMAKRASGIMGCIRQSIANRVETGDAAPLQASPGIAVSCSGLLSYRHGHTGGSLVKGHEDSQGAGLYMAHAIQAEGAGNVQPGVKKVQGRSYQCIQIPEWEGS